MLYIKQELHSYICSRVAKPFLILSQQAQGVTATLIQNRDAFFLSFVNFEMIFQCLMGYSLTRDCTFFALLHCHIFFSNWLQQHAYLQLKYIDAPYFICNYLYFSAVKSYYSLSVYWVSQGQYDFHSFPVVDWFCLFV